MVNNQNALSFAHSHDNSVGYVHKALAASHVSDCSRYDVFGTSGEELTIDNFKENGKRFLSDVSPENPDCKRVKQINDTDLFEGSPPSDDVACSGSYDLPWTSLGSPIWVPSFPNYCDYQKVSERSKAKEICSPIRESSPAHEDLIHKPVAIGPNHQAVITDWNPSSVNDNDADSEKWIKYSVSPLHNSDSFLSHNICCDCPDEGSVRCVRQHITEARENLRRMVGHEKFEKLGFCDMGEEVSLKWTAEEEKLFQEVVSSNPKSMDKNFWDDLPCAFPNKSSRDLVSYYFNVFILRKRAGQNRWDPTHIDSDDDEWEEPESKLQVHEEDEEEEEQEQEQEQEEDDQENESAIESLSDQDDYMCSNAYEESSEQSAEDEYYRSAIVSESKEKNFFDFQILNEDANTDSCTSFDENFHCVDANNGFGVVSHDGGFGVVSHDGIFDDLKVWDTNFLKGNCVDDFLSTCNVVEEFLGIEAWDNYHIDGDEGF